MDLVNLSDDELLVLYSDQKDINIAAQKERCKSLCIFEELNHRAMVKGLAQFEDMLARDSKFSELFKPDGWFRSADEFIKAQRTRKLWFFD